MLPYNESNEYYIVRGWFENSNGLSNGSFYGAVATPDNYLLPKRVVVDGEAAIKASEMAAQQPAKVYPEELAESLSTGDIAIPPGISGTVNKGCMPNRGGHGRTDGALSRVKVGNNFRHKLGRDRLRGIGNKIEMSRISQSGGSRGGKS